MKERLSYAPPSASFALATPRREGVDEDVWAAKICSEPSHWSERAPTFTAPPTTADGDDLARERHGEARRRLDDARSFVAQPDDGPSRCSMAR